MSLQPADDLRHAISGPNARESLFYNLHLPGEGLSVFFYTWVDAFDRAGRLFCVNGNDDQRLAFDLAGDLDAAGRDFDDWHAAGLTVRHTKGLELAELGYQGQDASLSLSFEGLHRAFPYGENEAGCPPVLADERFEQSGAVRGTLRVGGRSVDFDTTAHRDHSWGTRDWNAMIHWEWISAQAGPGVTCNALRLETADGVWVNGYVNRGGVLSALSSVTVDATYDAGFGHQSVTANLGDRGGATTVVEAERFSLLRFPPNDVMVMHEAGCAGTIDGVPALVHVEMGWRQRHVAEQVAARRRDETPAEEP